VRMIMNFCWRANLPLFALIYRLNNYWNLPRLWTMFPRPNHRWPHAINIVTLLGLYASIVVWVGPGPLLRTVGLAYLLMNIMLDVILLSQHSHIPMKVSEGHTVTPFSFAEQVPFTRSLRFPDWLSRIWLFGFDLHELHHEFPSVPGYRLPSIHRTMPNEVSWWRWTLQAKSTPADTFLFSNRDKSGLSL
jgi:omega-6 fatty acid desaturase (delta-12 desaturase)